MIKNIIFDMGNVLLNYNPQVSLNAFCDSEQEKEIIMNELFLGPEWELADQGTIKDNERYELVKTRMDKEHWNALKQCCDHWDMCMKPVEGAKEFCEYVKGQGYHIFVLSNASDKFYEYFNNFSSLEYFEGVVVSADIHMLKPDRKIYEYLLQTYGLHAEECLFIDDRANNVEAAIEIGMQAYQFKNDYDQIKKEYQL